MTHDELVTRAVKWLKQPYYGGLPNGERWSKSGCGVVVPEIVSIASEKPDAIGWYGGNGSYLIECKTSRSDFLVDQKKLHRERGVGLYRLYFCPPELIRADELPAGWGLLYCHPKQVTIHAAPSANDERNLHGEIMMMYSLLRRVEVRGQLRRCLAPKWGGDIDWNAPPSAGPSEVKK